MLPTSSTKDLQIWMQMIRKKWYIPALALGLSICIGLFLAFTIDPEYESRTSMMVLDTDLLSGSNLRFVPSVPQLQEIEFLRRLITSNDFLLLVYDSLDIEMDAKMIQQSEDLQAQYPHMPRNELMQQLYIEHLQKRIGARSTSYNTFEIRARGKTPEQAYQLCSLITQMAIDETQKRQLQSVNAASSLSHELLSIYRQRMIEAENRLRTFNSGMTRSGIDNSQLSAEKTAEIQSIVLATQIEKKSTTDEIETLKNATAAAPVAFRRDLDRAIAGIRTRLLSRTENVCMLYRQFTWRDLEVVQLNEEIGRLKKELHEKIESSINKYSAQLSSEIRAQLIKLEKLEIELAIINETLESFGMILNAHNETIKNEPSQQVLRERLLREINTNRDIYELLSQQMQGTEIRESAQLREAKMRYQILAPPQRPLERIKPNRKRIMMIAAFLGGLLGLGILVGLESIDLSIKYPEEVVEYLRVPVLATIPKIKMPTKQRKWIKEMAILITALLTLMIFVLIIF
ncbi:MAG TPA: GNVR domain-containing protein [bacterium]|nr:GNVR domain-containing protein [bacterium]HPM97407.1 GNVR domain-containing protein [bacterium]